jgi:serine/threonine protein kinase
MLPAAATLLQGRYRLGAVLGRGGLAAVYRADDLRLGCPVAAKLLPAPTSARAVALEREARLLAALRHPALPRVGD